MRTRNVIIAVAAIAVLSLPAIKAYGLGVGGVTKFGGKITNVETCTCLYDPALILTIDDKASKSSVKVKYSFFYSLLHMYYAPAKGSQVVGGSMPGNVGCYNQASYACKPSNTKADAVIDMIRGVGTSAGSSKLGGFSI